MSKAKGELVSWVADEYKDIAIIELPRGMRVIGKCRSCGFFLKDNDLDYACACDNTGTSAMLCINGAGCGNWKAKK